MRIESGNEKIPENEGIEEKISKTLRELVKERGIPEDMDGKENFSELGKYKIVELMSITAKGYEMPTGKILDEILKAKSKEEVKSLSEKYIKEAEKEE